MLRKLFALTEQGAKDMKKGIIASVFTSLSLMLPMGLLLMLVMQLLQPLLGMEATIYEFILTCRIDRAKELLSDHEKKISEIAALVGYERQSSFSAAFHQKTGITPNEFRRQFWNK